MGVTTRPFAIRLAVLGALAIGWAGGLIVQRRTVEESNYLDVSPGLLFLGCVLCLAAGAAARLIAGSRPRLRDGAIAGIGMVAAIVAGYAGLVVAYRDRFEPSAGGETPVSFLLEAWFWIGVPVVASAALGSIGWLLEDRLERVFGRRRGRSA